MIVTVWWEDARQPVRSKNYGPDQFLARCIADDLGCDLKDALRMFSGQPKKGAGTIKRLLTDEAPLVLNRGPLCAVLDHDKILELWLPTERPNDCHSGICGAIRSASPGDYYLVLLHENMETLVRAACDVMHVDVPAKSPQTRDDILARLVFGESSEKRQIVRDAVPGFNRLVDWVKAVVAQPTPSL
ncbi:MAG: hypothetical protein SF187_29355 [Deltaproteobacteria bacterium]|nr:hypothetical protein [Deltaproteobacteria bacterium]